MLIRVYKDKDAILVRYDEELRVAPMAVSWLGRVLSQWSQI